jgi:prepilin-type N-terminal cleavage/methylation domain-containing protein/prepilin-type processing-associated H-X9-DG protein
MKPRKTQRTAFTLIEVLVVVAIIALLVSILLPSLNGAREQARALVCKTRMRELSMAHVYYSSENGGAFPHWSWWLYDGVGHNEALATYYPAATVYRATQGVRAPDANSSRWVEYGQIYRYVRNKETYFCPVDNRQRVSPAIGSGDAGQGSQPIHSFARLIDVHDGYHKKLGLSNEFWGDGPHRSDFINPDNLRARSLRSTVFPEVEDFQSIPSRVALLFEEHQNDPAAASLNDGHSGLMWGNHISGRHNKRGHLSYWDGHAELVDAKRWNNYPSDPYAVHKCLGGGNPPPP